MIHPSYMPPTIPVRRSAPRGALLVIACVLGTLLGIVVAASLSGCSADQVGKFRDDHPKVSDGLDKGARIVTDLQNNPAAKDLIEKIPGGGITLSLLGMAATAWGAHARGKVVGKRLLPITDPTDPADPGFPDAGGEVTSP
jgi:hypothetical protein